MDEILVKGKDGKWYVLKGEELLPYKEETQSTELPKGVVQETHTELESKKQAAKPLVPSPKLVDHTGHSLHQELEELIDKVAMRGGSGDWDEVLKKRFRTIVSARLRDVRDSAETKAMLMRDQKIGGLAIDEAGSQKIMNMIEQVFTEFQKKWKDIEAKRIAEWKKKQRKEQKEREEQKVKEDEDELRKRYEKLTGKPVVETAPPKTPVRPPKPPPKPPKVVKLKVEKKPPPPPRPIPPEPLTIQPIAKPTPKPSIPKPMVASSKPRKLTDVRRAPRLTGPLEELSSITLKDFRRIAATPQAGVDKIIDKIDFLGKESLVRRSQGIQAWQKSPLARLYNAVSTQALSGHSSLQGILESFKKEGKPTLTIEEYYAIMELNQRLRF